MRSLIFASALFLMAAPAVVTAAPSSADDLVILSVAPRDPSVKPEIMLVPAKGITQTAKVQHAVAVTPAAKVEGETEEASAQWSSLR